MTLFFTKMHAAGNDYVYVDLIAQPELASHPSIRNPSQLANDVSARRTGIGADGLVLISYADTNAAAKMRMFNADGSEAEMCGNALRCVAHLLVDRGHVTSPSFEIQTGRGVLAAIVDGTAIRVEMGQPIVDSQAIPTTLCGNPPIDAPLVVADTDFSVTSVSMGNPHCVVFCDDLTDDLVLNFGPQIEKSSFFPKRTNVEFARVVDSSNIEVRVWERGSGETLACGTGACAVVVAGVLSGRCGRTVNVSLPGGVLTVDWTDDSVFLTGPVVEVFRGEWSLNS